MTNPQPSADESPVDRVLGSMKRLQEAEKTVAVLQEHLPWQLLKAVSDNQLLSDNADHREIVNRLVLELGNPESPLNTRETARGECRKVVFTIAKYFQCDLKDVQVGAKFVLYVASTEAYIVTLHPEADLCVELKRIEL